MKRLDLVPNLLRRLAPSLLTEHQHHHPPASTRVSPSLAAYRKARRRRNRTARASRRANR